jgi:hypothetical protein
LCSHVYTNKESTEISIIKTDLKSASNGVNQKQKIYSGNLKNNNYRDNAKLIYFAGGKDLLTLQILYLPISVLYIY